jgi:hypothetical protein
MKQNQESGLWDADCISFSSFPMKMLAYEGAIFVPIARGYNNASINHCFNKASDIDRKEDEQECHLSSHTILHSVIYPTSFMSTGQPYKNTQNCAKSSKGADAFDSESWLYGILLVQCLG